MDTSAQLVVVFMLERQRFAVALPCVVRVVPAVELTVVPDAPPVLVGVFDLQGEVIPVLDRRGRTAASVRVTDQLVVVRTQVRKLALLVDEVLGVVEAGTIGFSSDPSTTPGLSAYEGTVHVGDDLVLIHDIERFLSVQEAQSVDRVLEAMR